MEFAMVYQTSNRHIQAVVNNLKVSITLDCLLSWLRRNLGFWTDA